MKKILLTVFAAVLVAVPAVQAQKINKTAFLSKIEKSDADIADAKKNTKAATWMNRGKAFFEAASEPTKSLFVNMEAPMLKLAIGDPNSEGKEKLIDVEFDAWVYPFFTVYLKGDKVLTWKQTDWIEKNAISKAIEAYNKAYELDPKMADKVKEGLKQISDFCSQVGNTGIETGEYVTAAEAYAQAFEAQSSPAYGTPDASLLYYAGYLRAVDGPNNPVSFAIGAEQLNKALELGYNDEEGNIYYYLFHCYYGQREGNHDNLMKGKDALLAGIKKFPKNERILDGLVQIYTSPDDQVGNPADLVALIDEAIASNPENVDLWFGRGRIFYALKDYDQSITSFQKVVALKPDMFEGNYYLGVFYAVKADAMNSVMNEKVYNSSTMYDADLKAVNDVYRQAIPWFEKAHQLNPEHFDSLDMLKKISYRLRDEADIQALYDKYYPLWQTASEKQAQ